MKKCSLCLRGKAESEFNVNRSKSDGLQPLCRACQKKLSRTYYQENKDRLRTQISESKKKRIKESTERIHQIKLERGCFFCIESEPVTLDFHHLDRRDKEFTIGRSREVLWERLVIEIQKCLLVCANCHRKIHADIIDTKDVAPDWTGTSLLSWSE